MIPTGKYQFESNSQLLDIITKQSNGCDSYRKVPIWKQFTTFRGLFRLLLSLWFLQESTNLKAIHNSCVSLKILLTAVIPTGKYQFESNSQLMARFSFAIVCCDSYRKVPIWKQFTTGLLALLGFLVLWFLQESTNLKAIHNVTLPMLAFCQAVIPTGKYQFESNSQPDSDMKQGIVCCDSYRKVPIWKQFTTKATELKLGRMLWFLQESTNLKAIHN